MSEVVLANGGITKSPKRYQLRTKELFMAQENTTDYTSKVLGQDRSRVAVSSSDSFKARFVVAIDFGTSRSGYAFASVHDEEKIAYRVGNWPDQPFQTPKTPTLLLVDGEGKVHKCGYSALKHIATVSSAETQELVIADMFKMSLFRTEVPGSKQPQIKRGGRAFDTYPLVVQYLRWMKNLAVDGISRTLTGAWKDQEVRWCLTIPAIWTNEAKGLMRQAAIDAGLIGTESNESKRLNLVLEPEAAAVYCQTHGRNNEVTRLLPGDRFMVVDCGGGTLDITTHCVTDDHGLDALSEASGGPYGSMYVDREFRRLLEQKLGSEAMHVLSSQFPMAELKMLEEWERIKCGFSGQKDFRDRVSIHNPFYGYLQKNHPKEMEALASEQEGDDYVIFFNHDLMTKLFDDVLNGILDAVQKQLKTLNGDCDYIFLVGGFSESRYLQSRLNELFDTLKSRTRLVIPNDPSRAILGGAVAYGLNPSLIRTRRSRYTYGVGCSYPFDETLDKGKSHYFNDENVKYCSGRFGIHVRRGEAVPVDQETSIEFSPCHRTDTFAEFQAYRSRSANPRYDNEDGVVPLGKKVRVSLPMGKTNHERRVIATMKFGGTEVSIVLLQPTTGEKSEATFDLSSCFFPEDEG